MKQLASADFRKKYTAQAEPCEVTAHGKVIGTWIPFGHPISTVMAAADGTEMATETRAEPETPTRMTIRPVKGPSRVMVATEKRVLDPLEVRKREREMYSQLASRLYGPKRGTKS